MSVVALGEIQTQLVNFRSSGTVSYKDVKSMLADAERIFRVAKRDIQTHQAYGNSAHAQSLANLLKTAEQLHVQVSDWSSMERQFQKIQKTCKRPFSKSDEPQTPPCPLVPIENGELPIELIHMHFFDKINTKKDWAALMRVNWNFYRTANSILYFHWEKLKRSPPSGLVDLKYLAERIERGTPGRSPLFYFNQLKKEFICLGVDLSDRLPVTHSDFVELQKAVRPEYEKALFAIWQKAPLDPQLDSAESISKWLNDPSNAKIIRKITSLDLKGAEITFLPYEIRFFTGLTFFNLMENKLRALPREIGALKLIVWLSVCGNQLEVLPKEIGLLAELREFDASCNSLMNLPPEIGQLHNLNKLRLVQNNLVSLPPEIGSLRMLRILNLYCNSLESLPPEIGSLISLQHLGLTANALKTIPKEIGKLKQLCNLFLECNDIESLPEELGELTGLKQLDLHSNKLHSLPAAIGSLVNLEELHLNDNQLHFLPQALAFLSSLQNLSVHDNPIMYISEAILKSTNPCFDQCTGIQHFKAELDYRPTSALGELYHSIIRSEKEDHIKKRFLSLNDNDKKLILRLLGEASVFQNMPLFYQTVRAAISHKYWLNSAKLKCPIADEGESSSLINFVHLADAMDGLE